MSRRQTRISISPEPSIDVDIRFPLSRCDQIKCAPWSAWVEEYQKAQQHGEQKSSETENQPSRCMGCTRSFSIVLESPSENYCEACWYD